jgi:hypothetical protein
MRRGIATAIAAAILLTTAAPAIAAVNVRDQSEAMRYGASAPLGEAIADFRDGDDLIKTYAAPWPVNFFGEKFDGLCVTTNGGVYPVATVDSVCSNSFDYDLENLALESDAPMIAVLAADLNLSKCDAARIAERDGSGDGFGRPCTVYIDTAATIDGREAVVITWYRVSMHSDGNDETLANTFQLALIKLPTDNGITAGFNFDLEFNYGTIQDGEDGYSAADPADGCESGSEDCRWGIGIASYTPGDIFLDSASAGDEVVSNTDELASADAPVELAAVESAVGYEFFAPTVVADMLDDGATPLISNSLGTDVLGRYTCGMVNGAAVGCDPVTMGGIAAPELAAPELAETGASDSLVSVGLTALFLALTMVGAGFVVTRRAATPTGLTRV